MSSEKIDDLPAKLEQFLERFENNEKLELQVTVSSLSFSSDGKILTSGSPDGTLRFWDALTGALEHAGSSKRAGTGSDVRLFCQPATMGPFTQHLWH